MIASERNRFILNSLEKCGLITIKEIAEEINISQTTVRRDFEKLEIAGLLKRVQGGAIAIDDKKIEYNETREIDEKLKINVDDKLAVAKRAAEMVKDGDCIYLDDGTSIFAMIEFLKNKRIHIVTNSLLFASITEEMVAEIFIIGGQYIQKYCLTVGDFTSEILSKFHFDHAFIGCSGVSIAENKVYTAEYNCRKLKKLAMNQARKKHLLLDSSKLSRNSFIELTSLNDFDDVICNKARGETLPDKFIIAK